MEAEDVEMEDQLQQLVQSQTDQPTPTTNSTFPLLQEIAYLLMTGAYLHEERQIIHALRRTVVLRRKLTSSVVENFLLLVLTRGSEAFVKLWSYISELESPEKKKKEKDKEVANKSTTITVEAKEATSSALDTTTTTKTISGTLEAQLKPTGPLPLGLKLDHETVIRDLLGLGFSFGSESRIQESSSDSLEDDQSMEEDSSSPGRQPLPEHEMYCYLLVVIFLIDQKKYDKARACSSASMARLSYMNITTVHVLAARLCFYYSYTHELIESLDIIRRNLFSLLYRATLRRDELGQETVLNLLLRNYVHYCMYEQAEKMRSKAPRVEAHSNQQVCRYLFYVGKMRTIRLEYTDAKESLLEAALKAPVAALGFRIQCNKWAVMARLLAGEIPEKTVFNQRGMRKALLPYREVTDAVRKGDLGLLKRVAETHHDTFARDRTGNVIQRLRRNVICAGLRNISASYSRIAICDVARKLGMGSVGDAEGVVAKAIRDGGIDARVDHARGWMVMREAGDAYCTDEARTALDRRIRYCMALRDEAVKGTRFPWSERCMTCGGRDCEKMYRALLWSQAYSACYGDR